MASRVFESLTAGRGRLYPMEEGKRDEWRARVEQYDWWQKMAPEEQSARIPHFDGFIKVDAELVNALSGALSEHGGQPFRYNLEAVKKPNEEGTGLKQVEITYHIQRPPKGGSVSPQPVAESSQLPSDDIPF